MAPSLNEFGQPVGDPVPDWAPRPIPTRPELTGQGVRLEPLALDHQPDLFASTCGPGRDPLWTYLPAGPFSDQTAHETHIAELIDDPALVTCAIVDQLSGTCQGMASYLRIDPAAGSLEVGFILYGPALAHTRAATEAMWLMARHAFEDLGYRRYEWKCDALNAASRRAAQRLGFRYEGTFRQALIYKGRNRDTAWYAMTDADWRVLAPVYRRWLAADTSDIAGRLSELTRTALDAPPPTA